MIQKSKQAQKFTTSHHGDHHCAVTKLQNAMTMFFFGESRYRIAPDPDKKTMQKMVIVMAWRTAW